ncbi:MAG: CopG family transcriptional regulator [Thermoprotei archaeon]|nr:MAG: CopG family transcriptional regulator [Thermoprotei archaeon]
MSEVLSIRIPKRLKEELDELKGLIDVKSEVIRFLEERVKTYRRLKVLREIHEALEAHPRVPSGLAAKLVREDRDSH